MIRQSVERLFLGFADGFLMIIKGLWILQRKTTQGVYHFWHVISRVLTIDFMYYC